MRAHSLQALLSMSLVLCAIGHVHAQSSGNPVVACGLKEQKGCTFEWDSEKNKCVATCGKKGAGSGLGGGSNESPSPKTKINHKSASSGGSGVSGVGRAPE